MTAQLRFRAAVPADGTLFVPGYGHPCRSGAKLAVLCRSSARPDDLEVRCLMSDVTLPLMKREQRYFQHLA